MSNIRNPHFAVIDNNEKNFDLLDLHGVQWVYCRSNEYSTIAKMTDINWERFLDICHLLTHEASL